MKLKNNKLLCFGDAIMPSGEVVTYLAAELLDLGGRKELSQLDGKLFLEVYSRNQRKKRMN